MNRPRPAPTFAGQAIALAWGSWVELGVSGWATTHRNWAIDPEPLIVFTSFLADRDARLRDEATDWCVRNWRHVSKTRLRNLVRQQAPDDRRSFGEFAATVGVHAGITWPHATEPRRFKVTGKSSAPQLDVPSMAWVRLRAMFGIGARSEILRFFLSQEPRRSSVATISAEVGYSKRNVAEECESLANAGVLSVRQIGNRFTYSLAKRAELEAFVGPMAAIQPDWNTVFAVARHLVTLEEAEAASSARTFPVKAQKALDAIADELDDLGIETPPTDGSRDDLWPAVQSLGKQTLGAWSVGRWHVRAPSAQPARSAVRHIS